MVARLTSMFGGLALLLACLGLYGTISYGISRRVAELGLRMALGADRRTVLWMVLREALTLVVAGRRRSAFRSRLRPPERGSACSTASEPADPLSFGRGPWLLLMVAAVAAYLPAYTGVEDRADGGVGPLSPNGLPPDRTDRQAA